MARRHMPPLGQTWLSSQRRVQMGRNTRGLLNEQRQQSLIDLRRLERGEPEANARHVADEALDQLA